MVIILIFLAFLIEILLFDTIGNILKLINLIFTFLVNFKNVYPKNFWVTISIFLFCLGNSQPTIPAPSQSVTERVLNIFAGGRSSNSNSFFQMKKKS